MKQKTTFCYKLGMFFLILSFVELLLLGLQCSSFFTSAYKADSSLAWLPSYRDTVGVAAYIGIGSCAVRFFLIRLFTMQQYGERSARNTYLILCAAACVYENWYIFCSVLRRYPLGKGDIANLAFSLGLTLLILAAIMKNSRPLGMVCAAVAVLQTLYNVYALSHLDHLMSEMAVSAILVCEVLHGIGLCFSCLGIRALPAPAAEPETPPADRVSEK